VTSNNNNKKFQSAGAAGQARISPLLGGTDPRLRRNAQLGTTDLNLGRGLTVNNRTGRVELDLSRQFAFDREGKLALDPAQGLQGQGAIFVNELGEIVLRVGTGLTNQSGRVSVTQRSITTETLIGSHFSDFLLRNFFQGAGNKTVRGYDFTAAGNNVTFEWARPPAVDVDVDPIVTIPIFSGFVSNAWNIDVHAYVLDAGVNVATVAATPTETINVTGTSSGTANVLTEAVATFTAATILGGGGTIQFQVVRNSGSFNVLIPRIRYGVDSASLNGS